MEHLLPGLEPPKRTDHEKKKSLQIIEHRIKNKRRFTLKCFIYYKNFTLVIRVFSVYDTSPKD